MTAWRAVAEALKAEALAASDPESIRIYEQASSTKGPMADVLFRIGIRNPYIRGKLGLPPREIIE